MFRRSGITVSFALAFCVTSPSQSLATDQCSLELLETSAVRAAEVCTALLGRDEITTAARVDALKIRGRAMQRLQRNDDAILDYEAGLYIAPDDPELHLRRGWTAYEELRRAWRATGLFLLDPALNPLLDLAVDHARQALRLKPDYADAFSLMGAAFSIAGPEKFPQMKAAMDEAIRLYPSDPKFRFDRLIVLEKYGHFHEAIEDADAILRLPADFITKPSAAESFQRRTSFRIATAMERADMLKAVGRMNDVRQTYDQAVELDPDPITYSRRAAFRLTQIAFYPGMPAPPLDAVQDDIDKALALDPDYWVSHEQQAHLHFVREQYEAAATEFARALKQVPNSGPLRWHYALTLRKLGRGEEAAGEVITAFRLDRGFMLNKLGMLRKRGYLAAIAPDTDPRPALMDAARACMLDESCG
jgi:tetratricopeptide (TPR) repeat protein